VGGYGQDNVSGTLPPSSFQWAFLDSGTTTVCQYLLITLCG